MALSQPKPKPKERDGEVTSDEEFHTADEESKNEKVRKIRKIVKKRRKLSNQSPQEPEELASHTSSDEDSFKVLLL